MRSSLAHLDERSLNIMLAAKLTCLTQDEVQTRPTIVDELHERFAFEPVGFCREVLGFHPWRKQRQILRLLAAGMGPPTRGESPRAMDQWDRLCSLTEGRKKRTAVKSCNGAGKTAVAAAAAIWFLYCWWPAKVITTALTQKQVEILLWSEIRSMFARAQPRLPGECLTLSIKTSDPESWAIGFKAADHDDQAQQGVHAERMLAIVDEANAYPTALLESIKGMCIGARNLILMIGNPLRPIGEHYRAFNQAVSLYNTETISAYDHPNIRWQERWLKRNPDMALADAPPIPLPAAVTLQRVRDLEQEYGPDSPVVVARVGGGFPSAAEDQVIPMAFVDAMLSPPDKPKKGPRMVVADIAEFGDDRTVIFGVQGWHLVKYQMHRKRELMETAGWIVTIAREVGADRVVVDADGLGAGVASRLSELGFTVSRFRNGAREKVPAGVMRKYYNRRAEGWWKLREVMQNGKLVVPREIVELAREELIAPRYALHSDGSIQIEPKDKTKERLGRSPDVADTFMMWAREMGRLARQTGPVAREL